MNRPAGRAPIINAPLPLTAFALLLIALHAFRVFSPESLQIQALYHGALFPERFWGWAGGGPVSPASAPPYEGWLPALAPFVLSGLLHGDWLHVLLNAIFAVAFGKPVLDIITRVRGTGGAGTVMVLFALIVISQAAGGLVFLLIHNPIGAIAVGASGGLSGLLGAYLLMREGAAARLVSRNFLVVTAIFAAANVLLAVIGPAMLGASIAWEVHLGGYLAGAIFGRVLIWNALRRMDL